MLMKLNYRWAIFPPWYVYNALKKSEYRSDKLRHIECFFILWFLCQWLLIFASHKNFLLGIITANIALLGLFMPHHLLCRMRYSKDDQPFFDTLCVKIMNALTGIIFIYVFAVIIAEISHRLELTYNMFSFSSSYMWTSYHVYIKYLLIIIYIFPISLNFNEISNLFPKEDCKVNIIDLTYKRKIIIVMFYLMSIFLYFVTREESRYY